MLARQKSFMKNMAIPVCVALVSFCLPSVSSPSDEKSNYSNAYLTYYANALLLSSISINLITDELDNSQSDQNSSTDERLVQGNSKSKKKPTKDND